MNRKSLAIPLVALAMLVIEPAWSATVPEPEPEEAVVVFYRPKVFKGGGIAFRIYESPGNSVGVLSNGAVLIRRYEPGTVTFDASTPSVAGSDLITLDVEAGQTYFVKGEILLGWPAGRPKFTRVSEATGRAAVEKM